MRWARVVILLAWFGCSSHPGMHPDATAADDGAVDAALDAKPDGPPEIGFRIAGTSIGVCRPLQLDLVAGGAQQIPVTQDGAFEFPHLVPDGTFTIAAPGTSCQISGPSETNGADVTTIKVVCECVVLLQDIELLTPMITLHPAFDSEPALPTTYSGDRWFLLDDSETFQLTLTPAYVGATLQLDTLPATAGQTMTAKYGAWNVGLTYPATWTRSYAFVTTPRIAQDYVKAPAVQTVGNSDGGLSRVAISGDTLVAGAPQYGPQTEGLAFVYRRTGTTWAYEATLTASNAGANALFGFAVAIDGNTIVIGAPAEGAGAIFAGAAYVFTRTGTTWSEQAILRAASPTTLDEFGWSVAISADSVAVGARSEDGSSRVINGPVNELASLAGAAYVFVRSGTTWSQQAYVKAANADPNDLFGTSVGLSSDTLVVGAPGEASNATLVGGNSSDNSTAGAGAAYVFVRAGTTWTQQAYVKASNTGGGDQFGTNVSVDTNLLAVAAPFEASNGSSEANNAAANAGAVYVYQRVGTTWSKDAYLKASNPDAGDRFGWAIAINRNHLIVGARFEAGSGRGPSPPPDNAAADSGAVYVFRKDPTWSTAYYLKSSNDDPSDELGKYVAVDGLYFAAAAPGEDSNATGVNGNQANNSTSNAGAVYVFR